jgi:hypothetical protein
MPIIVPSANITLYMRRLAGVPRKNLVPECKGKVETLTAERLDWISR